jgi:APA family basic amino acid/polyamine antiporter
VTFGRLQIVALGAILITTLINCAAVKVSGNFATALTVLKVLVLILVGVGAFVYSGGDWSHLSQENVNGTCEGVAVTTGGFAGLAAAMLGALWAYDGWNNVAFMAGEVKQPQRNLPRALIISMFIIMALYVFVNLSYYHVLTPTQIASVPAASSTAAEVIRRLLGATAVTLMAAAMMTSSFGALHASILATARVPYAMAKDRLFFSGLAKLSRTHVPVRSLIVLAVWSSVLALSGSYDVLTDYAIFALTMFYALTAGAVFVFRKRFPDEERPYRTWGYPVVPVLFIVICTWLILTTIWNSPRQSAIGLGLIVLGLPVYWYWRKINAAR